MRADSIVLKTIKDRKLIDKGDILLLGLSGGPDSLCLLDILAKKQDELGFTLQALHVNHRIRKEADVEMLSVSRMCKERAVPLTVRVADIPAIAKSRGLSEEDAGRRVRTLSLKKKANELSKENPNRRVRVVLAHNKDDQAETVLMRILRGTGVHGIAAMEYERADGLIRPLLDTPRSLIEAYIRGEGLRPNIDLSNQSVEYTRNRIRLELIPMLEREYNPNLKDGLVRLAYSAREDDRYLNAVAKKRAGEFVIRAEGSPETDWTAMPRSQLSEMDNAVAKRVIKLMFARNGLKTDIAAVHMNALLDAVRSEGSAVIEFPKGYKANIEFDKVSFIAPNKKQEPASASIQVNCRVIPIESMPDIHKLSKDYCVLDALKILALDDDLFVRHRRSGDKIKPLGLGGTKKLQDYYTDKKITKEERDKIYLLTCGQNILWVKGYTVSDLCKVDDDTDFVLVTKIQEE